MLDRSGTFYSIGIRALLAGTSFLDRDRGSGPAHEAEILAALRAARDRIEESAPAPA